jgi:hypothetical protein
MLDLETTMAGAGESGQRPATGLNAAPLGASDKLNLIETKCKKAKRIRVLASLPNGTPFETVGQTARALLALVEQGERGITALEMGTWALRLGAYVHILRKIGIAIETIHETHNVLGDWHGRYVLRCTVQILECRA